jgi:hypothetical protein
VVFGPQTTILLQDKAGTNLRNLRIYLNSGTSGGLDGLSQRLIALATLLQDRCGLFGVGFVQQKTSSISIEVLPQIRKCDSFI